MSGTVLSEHALTHFILTATLGGLSHHDSSSTQEDTAAEIG